MNKLETIRKLIVKDFDVAYYIPWYQDENR